MKNLITALSLLIASTVNAQSFPSADQVFLPSAISIHVPWADYASDLFIENPTGDPVSISMTYRTAEIVPRVASHRDVIHLGPYEHREIKDILASIGESGFGSVIFNGCLEGADCAGTSTANYRDIAVHSRIYLPGPNGGTVGQNLDGIPWHAHGDARHPYEIVGIRVLTGTWRTNMGIVNANDVNSVTLTATLYDGASHAQRDQATVTLPPSGARQGSVTDWFPLLGAWVRTNPTRAATNAYVIVTSSGPDDAFFAYGSLIDGVTNDATTLDAFDPTTLTDVQIASLYGTPAPSSFVVSSQAKVTPVETSEACMARVMGPRSKVMVDALTEVIRTCGAAAVR